MLAPPLLFARGQATPLNFTGIPFQLYGLRTCPDRFSNSAHRIVRRSSVDSLEWGFRVGTLCRRAGLDAVGEVSDCSSKYTESIVRSLFWLTVGFYLDIFYLHA